MNYDARIDTADAQFDSSELGLLDGAEEEDRRSRRRVWIIGAICLAALIGLWFILHHGGTADSAKKGGNQAPAVTVISPGRGTIAGRINATGTLAARRELPVGDLDEHERRSPDESKRCEEDDGAAHHFFNVTRSSCVRFLRAPG